jgi:hypothetical protein
MICQHLMQPGLVGASAIFGRDCEAPKYHKYFGELDFRIQAGAR